MTNLLTNGNFEGNWRDDGNSQVPDGWQWQASEGEYTATGPPTYNEDGEIIAPAPKYYTEHPEMRVLSRANLPDHEHDQYIVDGDHALKLFANQKAFHVWLWQEASGLAVGECYEFVVPCYVDTYIWDGQKLPPNPNEAPTDRAARLQLKASDGELSQRSHWYDEQSVDGWYLNSHVARWRFEATAETMAVGLEVWNPWPISNNGWFFDGLSLTRVEAAEESECKGLPREQYKRIVNVIPASMPTEHAVEIFRRCWTAGRQTVTGSYDDAGLGDLDDKTAVLWEIPGTEASTFEDFYRQSYPHTKVEFAHLEEPTIWHRDIRDELVRNGEWLQRGLDEIVGLTVHHTTSPSPHNTAAYHVNGKKLPSIQYHIWVSETGETLYTESLESALYHDHQGYPNYNVSLGLAGNLEEHPPTESQLAAAIEVAAWAVEHPEMSITLERVKGHGDYANTACPGWQTGWRDEFYSRLRKRLGIDEPAPPPPPSTPGPGPRAPTHSFHAQAGADGQLEYVQRVKPSVFKLVNQPGMAKDVQAASPDTLIIFRKVWDDWHHYVYGYNNLNEAAADFIGWMLPEIQEVHREIGGARFAVEGLNETIACGAVEDIRRVVQFEAAFAYQLAALPYNCVPIVLNTAVGNPEHGAETEMLLPAVRAALDTDGYVGYHSYWPSSPQQTWLESDWRHFAGRWSASWDPIFRAHGLRPRYILTESGPIGNSNEHLDGWNGWRAPRCLNGDWARCLDEILSFDQLARASIPGQEGYYWGHTLFTTGSVGWDHFQYYRQQFEDLGNAIIG